MGLLSLWNKGCARTFDSSIFYNIYYLDLLSYSKFQQKLPISQDILMVLAMNKFSMYCTVLAPFFTIFFFSILKSRPHIIVRNISSPSKLYNHRIIRRRRIVEAIVDEAASIGALGDICIGVYHMITRRPRRFRGWFISCNTHVYVTRGRTCIDGGLHPAGITVITET